MRRGANFVIDDDINRRSGGLRQRRNPHEPVVVWRSKAGDAVAVREKAKTQLRVTDAVKLAEGQGMADWVQVDSAKLEGIFKKAPDRDQFGADIKEALIVELYSR